MYEQNTVEILNRQNTVKNITSEKVLKSFIEFLDVSSLTVRAYKAGISRLISFCRENDIKTPTREQIIDFKNSLISCGCKPATIAAYLSAIKRFFDWTESQGIYPNITRGIKAPKQDKGHKRDFLNATQLQNVMKGIDRSTLEGKRNLAIIALMSVGGLRTIEVIRANIEDISTIGGVDVLYIQGKGRTDKKDFIKLTVEVKKAIHEYLKARGQVKGTEPLFASLSHRNKGGRLTTRTISGIAKNSMKNAGISSPRLTAHSLRHSAVTIALMSGQSLSEVQYFARHSSLSTTQIYAHNIDRLKSSCEQTISNAIFANRQVILFA